MGEGRFNLLHMGVQWVGEGRGGGPRAGGPKWGPKVSCWTAPMLKGEGMTNLHEYYSARHHKCPKWTAVIKLDVTQMNATVYCCYKMVGVLDEW